MARSTRKSAPAAPAETRPFAVDSTAPFASLAKDVQQTIAENIAADKVAGLSGNELRAKYGERLTGPARRKVLRDFSLATAATIARSYAQYRDGQARIGSRHAREHGSQAAARIREHAAETVSGMSVPECRKVLRTAGHPVPAVRKGNETALREATVDALVIAGAQAA